jgi:hypothetical protein
MVENIKIDAKSFITEKTGNIKDHYRITSCIGRGIFSKNIFVTK